MKAIPAIYKDRVFKPLEAVELDDDTNVLIRIERTIVDEMTGIVRAKKEIIDEVVEMHDRCFCAPIETSCAHITYREA